MPNQSKYFTWERFIFYLTEYYQTSFYHFSTNSIDLIFLCLYTGFETFRTLELLYLAHELTNLCNLSDRFHLVCISMMQIGRWLPLTLNTLLISYLLFFYQTGSVRNSYYWGFPTFFIVWSSFIFADKDSGYSFGIYLNYFHSHFSL